MEWIFLAFLLFMPFERVALAWLAAESAGGTMIRKHSYNSVDRTATFNFWFLVLGSFSSFFLAKI